MVPGRRPQRLQHVHIAVSMHTCPRSRLWTEDRSTHRRRLHVDPPSGFIALYTYFMLRLGVLEWFSLKIYHDPEHLIHLFEDIHFMLFFVMLVFLLEAVLLVNASLKVTHPPTSLLSADPSSDCLRSAC